MEVADLHPAHQHGDQHQVDRSHRHALAPRRRVVRPRLRVVAMAPAVEQLVPAEQRDDEDQRVVLFNPAAERMFGCAASDALGRPLDTFIPERFRQAHKTHVDKFGQTGTTSRRMGALGALSGVRTTGEEFPIEASISHSEIGGQKLFTVILRDITTRKQFENELRQSEERAQHGILIWENTFDAIGEGILVYDSARGILRCNARAAEMMETDAASMIGLSFREAFARAKERIEGRSRTGKRAADYYLADNHGASTVVEVQTEFGRRFLVSIFPIQSPDGQLVNVVTWNDVSRLSEIQDQLGRSRRLATVGQLAAGVAHEVNNPLAAITTCAEAIMRDMRDERMAKQVPENAQWNYYLEEIVRQALRCKEEQQCPQQ